MTHPEAQQQEGRIVTVTERDLFACLYRTIPWARRCVIPHAPIGYANAEVGWDRTDKSTSIRYIDALVVRSNGDTWAVEIKVSISDLRRELAKPDKTVMWRAHTDFFYYLVTPDLLDVALAEIPRDIGVMTTDGYANTRTVIKRRPKRNPVTLPIPTDTWRRIASRYGSAHFDAILADKKVTQ